MKIAKTLPVWLVRDEFRIWTQLVAPGLSAVDNVRNICEYGFTEILNNVIDHSGGQNVTLNCEQEGNVVRFEIEDDGVGIFSKLRSFFDLDSDLHALIELVKGKLTVAPEAHSGEGLFFSSKMFDRFIIESGELSVVFEGDQCLVKSIPHRFGTAVRMEIASDSPRTSNQVFSRFCDSEELMFYRTRFLVSLAALEGNLVSRSQAKRVATRFENFSEVELDFSGVNSVGQGFADELFRVWPMKHQHTRLVPTHANEAVRSMLSHVAGRKDLPQPGNAPSATNDDLEP